MARIRSVHPEQWTDEDFCSLSPMARLLAIGIRNFSDDNGVFPCKPFTLKMWIFPADNCDMAALLAELESANIFFQYSHDGAKYGIIRNFHRFQRPDKPNFKYPTPHQILPDGYATRRIAVGDQSESGRRVVADRSGTEKEMEKEEEEDKEMEEELEKEKEEESIPIAADATSVQTSPASPIPKPDPLESYPKLLRAYQPLRDKLIAVHPKAKLPAIGSAGELKDRKAFADLARLDGYTEDEIIITIRWILRGETQQAAFWQQQFCSVAWLRKVRDGASRFTRSRAAMEREDAPQKPKSLTTPEPEGASAYYERVQREQREQQARYEQERLDEYLRANPEAAQEVCQ